MEKWICTLFSWERIAVTGSAVDDSRSTVEEKPKTETFRLAISRLKTTTQGKVCRPTPKEQTLIKMSATGIQHKKQDTVKPCPSASIRTICSRRDCRK